VIDRGRYLTGRCAEFALAVREITGWGLVEMRDHVLARMPDGRLLDALGPHDPGCLDGIWHRDADAGELARRFGRRAAAPDVVADARELLAAVSAMPPGEVAPFPWRPRARSVSAAGLDGCGLVPARESP
jgi:hypothetical protein